MSNPFYAARVLLSNAQGGALILWLISANTYASSGGTLGTFPVNVHDRPDGLPKGLIDAAAWHNGEGGTPERAGMAWMLAYGLASLALMDKANGPKDNLINMDDPDMLPYLGIVDGETKDSYICGTTAPLVFDPTGDGNQMIFVPCAGGGTDTGQDNFGMCYGLAGEDEHDIPKLSEDLLFSLIGGDNNAGLAWYVLAKMLAGGGQALVAGGASDGLRAFDIAAELAAPGAPQGAAAAGGPKTIDFKEDSFFHLALTFSVRVAAGDVNGDGRDDLIASSSAGTTGNKVYVVTDTAALDAADGTADGEAVVGEIDGTNGTTLTGFGTFNINGMPVATGDFDADGKSDVVVTSINENSNFGIVRVFLGSSFTGQATIDSSTLDGTTGFTIKGLHTADINTRFGATIVAGDVNNDGFDDLLIGAPGENQARGALYVVFGKAGGFDAEIDLSLLDGNNGFKVEPEDIVGGELGKGAVVGDFTGDGLNDIAVSANLTSTGAQYAGTTYIITGVDPNGAVTRTGTAIANIISGGNLGDQISGLDGDDWLYGRGGKDKVLGGNGKDQLYGDKGNDIVTGGAGRDKLAGGDGGKGEKTDGNDKFVFTDILDSGNKNAKADLVLDFFAGKDKIDVHLIDAKPGGADNEFKFIGTDAFTKAGQIRVVAHGNDTEIQINTVGKSGTDMMIVLDNIKPSALHEVDFIL